MDFITINILLLKAIFLHLADAVVLMTDWGRYPALDWRRIYGVMRKPALVYDTRNCLDAAALREIGFRVLNVGK